jgi:hypothetical protein
MLKFLIFAAHSAQSAPTSPADKGLSMEWGLVLIGVIIGVAITVMPGKRTTEIKKQTEE